MRYCNEFRIFLVGVSTFALGVGTSALANETQGEDLSQREIIVTGVPTTYNNSETTEPMIMQQTPLTSPLSMVDNLPGVSVQEGDTFGFDDWSTAISVRGFQTNLDEQQIGITIDGLPNGGSNYGGGSKANRFIDTMNIGRVEVSQGTADIGSLSNEALGGTLNFVTSDPLEDMRARFSVSIGEFDAQRFYARYGACQINPCWLREARNRPIHAAAADAVSHSSMAEVRQRRMVFREMRCRSMLKLL